MMESNERKGHTPGPWHAVEWDCDPKLNDDGNRFWGIKPVTFHGDANYLEASGWMTEANARLIASAPELLEALKEWMDYDHAYEANDHAGAAIYYDRALALTRAAITKAEG